MSARSFTITSLILVVLSVYLFISAPAALEEQKHEEKTIPIAYALEILEHENDIARTIYTKDIVSAGAKRGIKYDENWEDDDVHAGPLPAQFLRLTAQSLEENPVPLGLFLGSDYAISKSNAFEGAQLAAFKEVKESRQAAFFYVADAQRYAYMAPDIASSKPCVVCHNEHDESPKKDWKLNDVMGATTWTYPNEYVSYQELISMVFALRKGFEDAYATMLEQTQTMKVKPKVGDKWPKSGRYLPTNELFMSQVANSSDLITMQAILQIEKNPDRGEKK